MLSGAIGFWSFKTILHLLSFQKKDTNNAITSPRQFLPLLSRTLRLIAFFMRFMKYFLKQKDIELLKRERSDNVFWQFTVDCRLLSELRKLQIVCEQKFASNEKNERSSSSTCFATNRERKAIENICRESLCTRGYLVLLNAIHAAQSDFFMINHKYLFRKVEFSSLNIRMTTVFNY